MVVICAQCFKETKSVPEGNYCHDCKETIFTIGDLQVVKVEKEKPEEEQTEETMDPFKDDYKVMCRCGEEYLDITGEREDKRNRIRSTHMKCGECGREVELREYEVKEEEKVEEYRCTKTFGLQYQDEDGGLTDDTGQIQKDSIWEKQGLVIATSELFRMELVSGESDFTWIEVDIETIKERFEKR